MRVFWLLGILSVSAFAADEPMVSTREPDCTICYGDQGCLKLEEARCEYYLAADQVLKEEEEDNVAEEGEDQPELRETVDAMVYELVEKASEMNTDCIPYISEYSDCTKENICVGCQVCSCDALGAWNCSVVQRCRAGVTLNVDHRVLVSVMESLGNNHIKRKRRSIANQSEPRKMTYDEVLEWWYGLPIKKKDKPHERNPREINVFGDSSTVRTTTDPDYLAFDEVLRSLDVDNKNNNRRKPPLHNVHNVSYDYIHSNVAINITTMSNSTDNFMELLHALETSEEDTTVVPAQGVTKIVIDLLESVKKNAANTVHSNMKSYLNDYMDIDNKFNEGNYDTNNKIEELNSISLKKREIPVEVNDTNNATEAGNNTNTMADLKDSVLNPINNIINEKENELDELKRIRETLIKTIKSYQSGEIDLDLKTNQTSDYSDTHFAIYNLEVISQPEFTNRRANKRVLDSQVAKLKRDIIEVIRGAALIQKFTPTEKMPDNLKNLIRALKHYVRSEKKKGEKPFEKKIAISKTRRHYTDTPSPKLIKDCVVEIFQQLDKDMPKGNALEHLSVTAKKILRRIIKINYVDEFADMGMRVSCDKCNLTNDLLTIGNRWQKMTADVIKNPVVNRLYAMKLLHFVLSADIVKMTDALKTINFSRSRRMMAIDPAEGELIINNINRDVKDVYSKLQLITPFFQDKKPEEQNFRRSNVEKKKKVPFFKRIKKLLKGSKDEIKMLLRKKVPKSEIVEEIAKKKMDELTRRKFSEYEEIMKKWQNNMDIFPKREKRSARDFSKIKNRIKNIIPKYLRGKLTPAIAAKHTVKDKTYSNKKHNASTIVTEAATTKIVTMVN